MNFCGMQHTSIRKPEKLRSSKSGISKFQSFRTIGGQRVLQGQPLQADNKINTVSSTFASVLQFRSVFKITVVIVTFMAHIFKRGNYCF